MNEADILQSEEEIQKVFFSKQKLLKLHKKFGHAHAERLHNLVNRTGKKLSHDDLRMLRKSARNILHVKDKQKSRKVHSHCPRRHRSQS